MRSLSVEVPLYWPGVFWVNLESRRTSKAYDVVLVVCVSVCVRESVSVYVFCVCVCVMYNLGAEYHIVRHIRLQVLSLGFLLLFLLLSLSVPATNSCSSSWSTLHMQRGVVQRCGEP